MALGDVGIFNPAESNYGTPGAFDKMLQAEAQKRAAYLSSMDQFYENLAESQRQFDETLGFKTETRDLELDWAQEKFEKEQILDRERLSAEKEYNEGILSLKERELAGEEDDLSPFQRFKVFNMLEKEGESRQDVREEGLDLLRPGSSSGTIYGKDYENPYSVKTSAPQSGEVLSLAEKLGGRTQADNPNWITPEFDNINEREYDYP